FSALPALGEDRVVVTFPDGTGDPDATTCRRPQPLPNSRFLGPEVCKLNSQWALLRKNGEDISADGRNIISNAKGSGVAPMNCTYQGGGATTSGQMVCRPQ